MLGATTMTNNLICLCGKRRTRPDAKLNAGGCFTVLSQQEADVLCRVATGRASSDIARELSVSEDAIKQHIKSLLYKARARSKPHLAMVPQEQVCSFETMMAL